VAAAIVILLRLKLVLEAALVPRWRVRAGGQLPQVQVRRKKENKDYKSSEWWRLYDNTTNAADAYAALTSMMNLLLLKQLAAISFTITLIFGDILELFHKLVEYARTWFPENPDAIGVFVPLELLVLGVLKVLGRGLDFHELELGSRVSRSTHHQFFHKFVAKLVLELKDSTIVQPQAASDEAMKAATVPYILLGFHGCAGSMDCVHTHVRFMRHPSYSALILIFCCSGTRYLWS